RGDIGITTFRNALRAHYLPHSSGKTSGHDQISNKDATVLYCLANGVEIDYAMLIWEDIIHKLNKITREKTEASKSKTGQSDKVTQFILASDKSPSHPSPSTLVVVEMHKEAQQAAGGPTSLGATSEEGAHPQLSSGQATTSPGEGEKNTNPATKDAEPTNLHKELVDLLGIDVVTQYYNKKLLYDKYRDKILRRRKISKIINCDVLIQKGPILMNVNREDEINEVILNFKVIDLHLAEWREVVQACPDRKEKGWKTIYGLIKTR
nr:hypothetical protein [Tanacetum cinerariifolium]